MSKDTTSPALRRDLDKLGAELGAMLDRDYPAFFRDMERRNIERIQADPEKHRDTHYMGDGGLRYRYYKADKRTSYCYATTKNAAGYWLTWTEVVNSKGDGKRLNIRGHKRRKDAKESALKGYENHGR